MKIVRQDLLHHSLTLHLQSEPKFPRLSTAAATDSL